MILNKSFNFSDLYFLCNWLPPKKRCRQYRQHRVSLHACCSSYQGQSVSPPFKFEPVLWLARLIEYGRIDVALVLGLGLKSSDTYEFDTFNLHFLGALNHHVRSSIVLLEMEVLPASIAFSHLTWAIRYIWMKLSGAQPSEWTSCNQMVQNNHWTEPDNKELGALILF